MRKTTSYPIYLLLTLLTVFSASAQHRRFDFKECPDLPQMSPFTKVFAIPRDSVLDIVFSGYRPKPQSLLFNEVFRTLAFKTPDALMQDEDVPAGHYLAVRLERNNVIVTKHHKAAFKVEFIDLGHIMLMEVRDTKNQPDNTVTVKLGKKELSYDARMKGYVLPGLKHNDTLSIAKGQDIWYYNAYVQALPRYPQRPQNVNTFHGSQKKYKGYMVTNKPKYVPGDTVKWKAYVLNPFTGKPATEPLRLSMTTGRVYYAEARYYGEQSKKRKKKQPAAYDGSQDYRGEPFYNYGENYLLDSAVNPAGPGVYFGEYVVGDTIKMDNTYNLIVTGLLTGNRINTEIETEDYLLRDLRLKVKTNENLTYQEDDSIKIFVYAATANNLPLLDGKIRVTVTPYWTAYGDQKEKFPDTLFNKEIEVDPSGESSFTIPLNDLPNWDNSFRCHVHAQNSSNDSKDTTMNFVYKGAPYYILPSQKGKKVAVKMMHNRESVTATGFYRRNYDTTKIPIRYPAEIEVTAYDGILRFFPDTMYGSPTKDITEFQLATDQLTVSDDFIKDTAYLWINNPQKAFVRFSVYVGNKFVGIGQTSNDTVLKVHSPDGETVTIQRNHYWRQAINKTDAIYKYDKRMNIELFKKDLVYPGQQDSITIRLTDIDGNGITNTNLTVLAFNEQFGEDHVPQLPYQGYIRAAKGNDTMRSINPRSQEATSSFKLDDIEWVHLMDADSIFLYREILMNLHKTSWIRYKINSSRPQMSVHVKENGVYVIPEIIYVDNIPIFYRPAGNNDMSSHNSFYIRHGPHVVKLRFAGYQYVIYNVNITDSTKLNVFVNGDVALPQGIVRSSMPTYLEQDERQLLSQYFIMHRAEYNHVQAFNYDVDGNIMYDYQPQQRKDFRSYMEHNRCYFQMAGTEQLYNVQGKHTSFVGPFAPGAQITFYQFNNTKQKFAFERNQTFIFRDGMIRVEQTDVASQLPNPTSIEYWPELCYLVPTGNLDTFNVKLPPDTLVPQYVVRHVNRLRPKGSGEPTVSGRIYNNHSGYSNNKRVVAFKKNGKDVAVAIVSADGSFNVPKLAPGIYKLEIDNGNKILILPGTVNIHKDSVAGIDLMIQQYKTIEEVAAAKRAPYSISGRHVEQSTIEGTVRDENGEPVIGAVIEVISGGIERGGGATNYDGEYAVKPLAPGKYEVILSYPGYSKRRITDVIVSPNRVTTINIDLTSNALKEVVIKYIAPLIQDGPVTNVLSGEDIRHMPSISMTDIVSASGPGLRSEGRNSALNAAGARSGGTVTFIDGVTVNSSAMPNNANYPEIAEHIDAGNTVEFMTSDKTQGFLSEFMNNQLLAAGLRKNFRDYAIWEPNLWTDRDGISRFSVTYPDNITAWRTYVLAMNENGFAGRTIRLTHAFKPLSAQLSLPRFLRYGDTAFAIGKISNYTQQAFKLNTSFLQDGKEKDVEQVTVNNVKVSPLQLEAPAANRTDTGSLTATYSLKAENGFMDGEEKKIPIYFVGTTESKGSFSVLTRDTVIHTRPENDRHFTGKSWIMIDGSLLDVMLREIENLKVYPYGCTEQLTTKLLAVSYEEKVKKILGVDTVNNGAARDSIVKALIKLQNNDGSFGWWNERSHDYRITNYVLSTMQKIDPAYRSALIVQRGLLFLESHLPLMPLNERIISLRTLSEYGYNMKYADHLANINDTFQNVHDQFAIATIKKQQGLPYRYLLDTLMKQGKWEHGLHWNQFSYDWYRNDIPTTLMGYQLIEKDSVYGHLADNIMQYLLYSRRGGYYRNTAESGQVLATLLPGLMANTKTTISNRYTEVVVSGSITDTLKEFPKTYERKDKNIDVTINKKGLGPAYVSVVYDYLTAEPEAKKDVLKINTYFIKGRDTLTELHAGTEVNLKVVVNVDTAMDYVMIEVPIPAGCSQVPGKTRGYNESNRENYKDRTIIYCGSLYKGRFEFDIPLEVRYKGRYHMNPARAAMMYYPDKYGNNEVKLVKIR